MKDRTIAIVISILLAAVAFVGCAPFMNTGSATGSGGIRDTVEEVNANSNLPMALLTPYEEVRDTLEQDSSLDFINNFMSADFYADGYMLSFGGFPEDDSPYCLTTIELTDGNYDVCGVAVGGDLAQAAQTLEGYGYSAEDGTHEFVKDGVVVALSGDSSGLVEEISISVPSRYTSGNLY